MADKLLTPDEAAELLGISKLAVLELFRDGELKGKKSGHRTIRFLASAVDAYMHDRKPESEDGNVDGSEESQNTKRAVAAKAELDMLKAEEGLTLYKLGIPDRRSYDVKMAEAQTSIDDADIMRQSYDQEKAKATRLERENIALQKKLDEALASTEVDDIHTQYQKEVAEIRKECEKRVTKAETADKMMWTYEGSDLPHFKWGNKLHFLAFGQVYRVTAENYALVNKIAKDKGVRLDYA